MTTSEDEFTYQCWTLVVELDEPDSDRDDVTRLLRKVRSYWGISRGELATCVRVTSRRVEVTSEVIDALVEIARWAMMHTWLRGLAVTRRPESHGGRCG